jgi:hypothetical protein
MKRRMDKYYNGEYKINERTKKNETLYNTVYNLEPISEVVDMDAIKEINLLKDSNKYRSREEYQKLKIYKSFVNSDENGIEDKEELIYQEEKSYDLNNILEKAKDERKEVDDRDKYRKLRSTQYNILNGLNLEKDIDEYNKELECDEKKLKELIHTITINKRQVNALKNKENTSNLLSDMMTQSLGDMIEKEKEEEEKETNQIDESFYSSSFNFSKEDFEKDKITETKKEKKSILKRIIIFILIIIITSLILLGLNYYFNF